MENPTFFLLFLCISLVSVFVFGLLVCEAQGQSRGRFFVSQSPIPPLLFVFLMGEDVWASGSVVSVLCPISIQNVLALLIFGLGWGESTITIPQSLKVKLSIQGSWHEDEMEKRTDTAQCTCHICATTACPLSVITLLLLLKPSLKPRCHILSQMCHFGQDLQQLNAMVACVNGMVLSILQPSATPPVFACMTAFACRSSLRLCVMRSKPPSAASGTILGELAPTSMGRQCTAVCTGEIKRLWILTEIAFKGISGPMDRRSAWNSLTTLLRSTMASPFPPFLPGDMF